jgi:hypothetical protein
MVRHVSHAALAVRLLHQLIGAAGHAAVTRGCRAAPVRGARRVRADLVRGRGAIVGSNAVAMLMPRGGLKGPPHRRVRYATRAADLVDRQFTRTGPSRVHSDHAVRFTSWAFTDRAERSGLPPSMGSVGDAYDSPAIESFRGRMRTELVNRRRWKTHTELANAIFDCSTSSTSGATDTPRSRCGPRSSPSVDTHTERSRSPSPCFQHADST